jgi:hypothetical protein
MRPPAFLLREGVFISGGYPLSRRPLSALFYLDINNGAEPCFRGSRGCFSGSTWVPERTGGGVQHESSTD